MYLEPMVCKPPHIYHEVLKFIPHPRSLNAEAWQARQDLNLQPPVLETGALPIELLTYLTGFFMRRVFVAEATIFLVFHTARLVPPVFSRGVIAPAAYFAFQRYLISWH